MTTAARGVAIWSNSVAVLVLFALGLYTYFYEEPYLSYGNGGVLKVQQSAVRIGDTVPLTMYRCSKAKGERVFAIARRLINDKVPSAPDILLPGSPPVSIKPGCTVTVSALNQIPSNTPPGFYHIEGISEINGFFHTFTIKWRSDTFQVIPADSPAPVPPLPVDTLPSDSNASGVSN